MLINIIRRYSFNILTRSSLFYLITKRKLNENEITYIKIKKSEIQFSANQMWKEENEK